MVNPEETGDRCIVCGKGTKGGFEVSDRVRKDGTFMVIIDTTPDRDFNVCDLCNDVVHFHCSSHPGTGYCDKCLDKIYPNGVPPSEEF